MLPSNLCPTHLWLPHGPPSHYAAGNERVLSWTVVCSETWRWTRPTTHHCTAAMLLQAGSSRHRLHTKFPLSFRKHAASSTCVDRLLTTHYDSRMSLKWTAQGPPLVMPATKTANFGTPENHRHSDQVHIPGPSTTAVTQGVWGSELLPGHSISCKLLLISLLSFHLQICCHSFEFVIVDGGVAD